MTTICKVRECPFLSEKGFCRNELLSITQNAQCGWVFDINGRPKEGWRQAPAFEQGEGLDDKK